MWLIISIVVHLGMLVLFLLRPQLGWLALAGVVLNHLLLLLGCLWPRCRWLGPNMTALPNPDNRVAITFDDGPDPDTTPQVLRILEHYGATASFFCVAARARAHPALVREMTAAGHRLENHTATHPWYFAFMGPRGMSDQILQAQTTLTTLTGRAPHYFRAPAGMRNPWLAAVLARHKLQLVSWTRRGLDTIFRDPDRVLARLLRQLQAGDILVLHDLARLSDRHGRPLLLSVLPRLLEHLAQRGLRAVALPT